jgi:hypothetical protein
MGRIIFIFIFFNITTSSKMIPIIKKFKENVIKIEYYIDDNCEDCLEHMTPCEYHLQMQRSRYLKLQWQRQSYLEEIERAFGEEVAHEVEKKLKED